MELDDKRQFLEQCPPFSALDEAGLDQCLKKLSISYLNAGTRHALSEFAADVCLLRTGSLEFRDAHNAFLDRLSVGDCFSGDAQIHGQLAKRSLTDSEQLLFLEDSLIFHVPVELVSSLARQNDTFALFFKDVRDQGIARVIGPSKDKQDQDYRLNQRVSELMIPSPLCSTSDRSIREAAKQMAEAKISSLLIVEQGVLTGIVTDRDLRCRVLAEGVDTYLPVAQVMTPNPKTIRADQTIYECQLKMMTENIHHLPVIEYNEQGEKVPVGIIALTDVIRAQNSEPVFLIQAINRAANRDAIYQAAAQLPALVRKLIRAHVPADETGRIITSITDAITRQLIALALKNFGPAPRAYAWVVFGSQARQDQMLGSDQDNGLILSDEVSEQDQDYFKRLAEFVNEGLDKSGLKYCPGDIMAQNTTWRQPLKVWQGYFQKWIRQPEPKALMHASIFYDIRHVAGERSLTDALSAMVLKEAQANSIFQACMCQNALEASPPLGFFKNFVLEKDGNHNAVFDLKLRGTVPIVALVRLYCLANGLSEVNTAERLKALGREKILSAAQVNNLLDAHAFIADLRLESQIQLLERGETMSNRVNPESLSPLVRHQLKDAFLVVAESQRLLKMRFGHGAL